MQYILPNVVYSANLYISCFFTYCVFLRGTDNYIKNKIGI
jgi:hypothetical protein